MAQGMEFDEIWDLVRESTRLDKARAMSIYKAVRATTRFTSSRMAYAATAMQSSAKEIMAQADPGRSLIEIDPRFATCDGPDIGYFPLPPGNAFSLVHLDVPNFYIGLDHFETLWSVVEVGGILIVEGYLMNEHVTKYLNEFFIDSDRPERIRQEARGQAIIIKEPPTAVKDTRYSHLCIQRRVPGQEPIALDAALPQSQTPTFVDMSSDDPMNQTQKTAPPPKKKRGNN